MFDPNTFGSSLQVADDFSLERRCTPGTRASPASRETASHRNCQTSSSRAEADEGIAPPAPRASETSRRLPTRSHLPTSNAATATPPLPVHSAQDRRRLRAPATRQTSRSLTEQSADSARHPRRLHRPSSCHAGENQFQLPKATGTALAPIDANMDRERSPRCIRT